MSKRRDSINEKIWINFTCFAIDRKSLSYIFDHEAKDNKFYQQNRKEIIRTIRNVARHLLWSKFQSFFMRDKKKREEISEYVKHVESLFADIYKDYGGIPVTSLYELAKNRII